MSGLQKRSIASLGVPVDFFMRGCSNGKHIDAAVEALMAILDGEGLHFDTYARIHVEETFRDRLEQAELGRLIPTDHVKSIECQPSIDIFEIRWSVEGGQEECEGVVCPTTLQVRLLYVEPAVARCLLGLHAFEKWTDGTPREIRRAQDAEIDHAVGLYGAEYATRWGVPELHPK